MHTKLAFTLSVLSLAMIVGCQSSDSSGNGGATTGALVPDSAQNVDPLGEGVLCRDFAAQRRYE